MTLEILLVDDDIVVQYLHKAVLSKCNFPEQNFFSDGQLVLDYILKNKDEDILFLILLDINMPVMSGWEFLDELKNHTIKPLLKVVIVTSSIDSSDKEKAEKYQEVFEFMEKPLQQELVCNLKTDPDLVTYLN
mgnify:FL=1